VSHKSYHVWTATSAKNKNVIINQNLPDTHHTGNNWTQNWSLAL